MSSTISEAEKKRLFVLLSGRGSNFLALHEAIARGELPGRIVGVLSNVAGAGIERAEELGYPVHTIPSRGTKRRDHERDVTAVIDAAAPDFILLAGYMRILTPEFVRRYPRKIVNIHPALLPSLPGVDAQAQAIEYGVKVAGCTVHLVDEGVDTGPIILQKVVPVLDSDDASSLAEKILELEHRAYPEAVSILIEGNWEIVGRRFIRCGRDEIIQRRCFFSGRVQGVCFRAWTERFASDAGVDGWVRNLPDGRVEALFRGSPAAVEETMRRCREDQPHARVIDVEVMEESPDTSLSGFSIRY